MTAKTPSPRKLHQPLLVMFVAIGVMLNPCYGQPDIEEPPIEYSKTADNNRVTDLMEAIKRGDVKLQHERGTGNLKSLLEALEIPVSSQALVFSKTSMQITYISPRSPRAIYFNDDTYVGWVQGSSLMEISTNDPKLGAAFYTVRMSPTKPHIKRQFYNCLACHTSTMTQGIPGHTVRSVMAKPDGKMDVQRQSFVTDHKSPFAERWGGWYVTGDHGDMRHMGNAFLRGDAMVATGEPNRSKLTHEFYTNDWLSPHSDIVALMVLEHQTQMQNTFTAANFIVRRAIYDHEHRNADDQHEAGDTTVKNGEGTRSILKAEQELAFNVSQAAKKVVDYMLFVNEASLTSQIKSSTSFPEDFAARGLADSSGRSLRDFNLRTRMFEYPCSYLIYSPAFNSLEQRLRDEVYLQLWSILTRKHQSKEYAHLSGDLRRAILDILRATKPDLPEYWSEND